MPKNSNDSPYDSVLDEIGISIQEDGTSFKTYRQYYYAGIKLKMGHVKLMEANRRGELISYIAMRIYEAGQKRMANSIRKLIMDGEAPGTDSDDE